MGWYEQAIKSYSARMGRGWMHQVNGVDCGFQARPLGRQVRALIKPFDVAGIRASNVEAHDFRLFRAGADVNRDKCDHLFAELQLSGETLMVQDGQQILQTPGDLVFFDAARPVEVLFKGSGRQLSVPIPRQIVDRWLNIGNNLPFLHVSAASSLGRLAAGLMLEVVNQPALDDAEGVAAMSSLLTLLRPRFVKACGTGGHELIYRQALSLIEEKLTDVELTPAFIAGQVGVSMRGLYRIFAAHGVTLSSYIKARRLDFCAEKIRCSEGVLSLSALCFDAGFSNSSHFSTAFKKHFGVSPSQYLKQIRAS